MKFFDMFCRYAAKNKEVTFFLTLIVFGFMMTSFVFQETVMEIDWANFGTFTYVETGPDSGVISLW